MKPFVKICGLTNVDDALSAAEAGADFLGFVFASSPRQVDQYAAEQMIEAVRRTGIPNVRMVGLFTPVSIFELAEIAHKVNLDIVQLHGEWSPQDCATIQKKGFQVSRAFQIKDASTVEEMAAYQVDYYHCDAWHPTLKGGTGQAFDYGLVREEAQRRRIILAGGLTPDNVAEAVRTVQPFAVDVSSGVEDNIKGQKNIEKVRCFIQSAKDALTEV